MATAPATGHAIYWVDRPVEVFMDDGVVVARIHSGRETFEFRGGICVLLVTMANMAKCYAASLARQARIIPFPKR